MHESYSEKQWDSGGHLTCLSRAVYFGTPVRLREFARAPRASHGGVENMEVVEASEELFGCCTIISQTPEASYVFIACLLLYICAYSTPDQRLSQSLQSLLSLGLKAVATCP